MTDKASLRRELRRRRLAVPRAARQQAARRVAQRALLWLQPGLRIGAYQALGSELSLAVLITLAQQRGCSVWLPVVPRRGRQLSFADVADPRGRWRRNRHGIAEYHAPRRCTARALDVVFLPLVGFDAQGGRLGQGGGYYDSSFARRIGRQPKLIGAAFDCQRVPTLTLDAHDVRLDAVLTERCHYRCRAGQLPG